MGNVCIPVCSQDAGTDATRVTHGNPPVPPQTVHQGPTSICGNPVWACSCLKSHGCLCDTSSPSRDRHALCRQACDLWGSRTTAHLGILVPVTVTLTPRWPPWLAGAVHLHPLRVYTPALHLPQATLHGRVVPGILALREVGGICAVDVTAQQDLLPV